MNRRPLDPRDIALALLPGQQGFRHQVLGGATCGSSGRVHGVWSQSGPNLGGHDRLGVNSSHVG